MLKSYLILFLTYLNILVFACKFTRILKASYYENK